MKLEQMAHMIALNKALVDAVNGKAVDANFTKLIFSNPSRPTRTKKSRSVAAVSAEPSDFFGNGIVDKFSVNLLNKIGINLGPFRNIVKNFLVKILTNMIKKLL